MGISIATLIVAAIGALAATLGIFLQRRIDRLNTTEMVRVAKLGYRKRAGLGGPCTLYLSLVNNGRITIFIQSVALVCPSGKFAFNLYSGPEGPFEQHNARTYELPVESMKKVAEWESVPDELWIDIKSAMGLVKRITGRRLRAVVNAAIDLWHTRAAESS